MAWMPLDVPYAVELENAIAELAGNTLEPLSAESHGNAVWTPRSLLTIGSLMSWDDGQTLTARFIKSRELLAVMRPGAAVPASYNGYAKALVRTLPVILATLRPRLQAHVRRLAGDRWQIGGWIVFAVDGSRFESPRTARNEEQLGCAGKTRTAPQVSHTTLIHLGTNAIWDFRCGAGIENERRHLEEMLAGLPAGSLVTADAGFSGYDLCRRLLDTKVHFLLRVGGNVTLLAPGDPQRVERRGGQVWLWPQSNRSSPPVILRLICLRRGRQSLYLVTNLPESQLSRKSAQEIYQRRWGIEVCYRSMKQTLDRRRWLSRSPQTVLAEHQVTILGFWLLQLATQDAVCSAGGDPRRWSPARARNVIRQMMWRARQSTLPGSVCWRDQLARARQDNYIRKRPKRARDWPHKKKDPLPSPPQIRPLAPHLKRDGKALLKST